MKPSTLIGLGATTPKISFYIGNIPDFIGFNTPTHFRPAELSELAYIVSNTSNHWRKVFNVYAKVMWQWLNLTDPDQVNQLEKCGVTSWQHYRDNRLFQREGNEALIFSAFDPKYSRSHLHVFAGKTYGHQQYPHNLIEVNQQFWISPSNKLIIAPYPDYRQLTNARIDFLISLLYSL